MGMFDDLIPGAGGQGAAPSGGGMFDDLIPQSTAPRLGPPEEMSGMEKMLAGVKLPHWVENLRGAGPVRALQGAAADPMIGAMQTVANVLPDSTGIPQAVNKRVADLEADTQSQRKAMGSEGFDWWRAGGTVFSPVNAAIAMKLAPAATAGMRAVQGAGVGAGTAAAAPVADTESGFWGTKSAQVGTGFVTGAILTPILGKVADYAVRKLGVGRNPNVRPSSNDVDGVLVESLKEAGQSLDDIPPDQLAALRQQVTGALEQGKSLDASAALRKADFEALGMQGTRGQITRDPMQFAREQNLRGVENVGEPLSARFQQQGQQLQARMSGPAAGARDAFNAGTSLTESLKRTDDTLRKHVSGLYGEARASSGKDLDVPLQGLATDYADVLHRYGDKVPSGVRNVLEDFGLLTGKQNKIFTFEEADKALKVINANRSNTDPAINGALDELRTALRKTVEGADSGGGPYAPAVRAAAERFKLQDAVPALKAAAQGSVAPDDFVARFVINGKTNDVKGLSKVLKQTDPEAWQEARAQIADTLKRAAFGENAAGDSPFSPSRYMQQIRKLGPDKLGAFFSAQEVADIMRVGRVGAYIKQAPNAAAVSSSNSQIGLINVLGRVPGLSGVAGVANRLAGAVKDQSTVRSALAAEVPMTDAPLNAGQRNWLAYILAGGAAGAGAAVGRPVGQ